jgi:signal transduction histidine kinase
LSVLLVGLSPLSDRFGSWWKKPVVRFGLKFHVTATLSALLFLATLLTFFVVTSFWLRESALSLAKEKERELSLLAERQSFFQLARGRQENFFAVLATQSIERSGAVAACFRTGKNEIDCVGGDLASQESLRQALAEGKHSDQAMRSLQDLVWVGGGPGKRYLDLTKQLTAPDRSSGAVALRYSLESHYETIRMMQRYVAVYLAANLVILLVVGFFRFRSTIFQPVEDLIRLTDSYTEKNGVPFLVLRGGDELSQLAGSMHQMLSRIKTDHEKMQQHLVSLQDANQQLIATRAEMVRAEKLSSVGRLAAGLAHEIGNPLSIVQGYLGLIQQTELDDHERREFCARAEQEVQRIGHLIRQLLDFSRPATGIVEDVEVHQVLLDVIALLQPQPLMDGIELVTRFEAVDIQIHCNADQLIQVFLNCLMNAADAIHTTGQGKGVIEVVTESIPLAGKHNVRVTIMDTGIGLAEEHLANAFDPFYTTKEPGKGTGLGLSVSYALLNAMGGTISLVNRAHGGAMVIILLPAVSV